MKELMNAIIWIIIFNKLGMVAHTCDSTRKVRQEIPKLQLNTNLGNLILNTCGDGVEEK